MLKHSVIKTLSDSFKLFWLILAFGIFFRVINFPGIPAGLNQDEVAAGYEAFSLLHSGADKWGNILPAYFVAWGSGQSVLLSYLQIPFIYIFGLNVFSIRLPSLILGILILPLIYKLAQKWFDTKTALIALLLASFLPWPVVISRWGLEANILPFFIILGLYLITLSLEIYQKNILKLSQKILILVSLLPFSLALYAYGLSIIPVAIFIIIFIFSYKKYLLKHKSLAISSILIFGFFSIPMALFVIKNNILKTNLGFEKYLGFTIPLLNSNRLTQINDGFITTIASNFYFIVAGFPDSISWNNDPVFLPLGLFSFPFLAIGIYFLINKKSFNFKKFQSNSSLNLALIWLLSFSPLLFFVPINTTRSNSILYLIIILIAFGITKLSEQIADPIFSKYFFKISVVWIILYGVVFQLNYNFLYPKKVEVEFNRGIENTLEIAKNKATRGEQIYLTKEVLINYVYPLFVFEIQPEEFRAKADIKIDDSGYNVHSFDNFVFDKNYLKLENQATWLAILKPCQNNWCDRLNTLNNNQKCYKNDVLYETDVWQIVRCYSR